MSKLRLIQCGVGGFGYGWIRNHASKSPDFDLVGIVDVQQRALDEAGEAVGLAKDRRFGTIEAAMDACEADAVLTVTPPAVHLAHAKAAFARGLHVMTEKPIAATIEDAREMVKLAAAAGKQLVVSQNYRYRNVIAKTRDLLREKAVGELGHGHIDFYIPADFTGTFRQSMPYVLLIDMAIHHLDLLRYITGRNIVSITAQTFRPAWSWYDHHCGLKMLMELEGGIPITYSGDWSARGQQTTWNGDWRLQCSEGAVHLDGTRVAVTRSPRGFRGQWETQTFIPPELQRLDQTATLALFADAIRSGTPAEISGADNLWSFGAVIAARLSSEQQRSISVRELVNG